MYHILKSESFGSMSTDGCPTPGRSHAPSVPAENTGINVLFESCDTVQVMPSVDVANPIPALLVPKVMLNHIRYMGPSSTTAGFATAISPRFVITVPRSVHWIPSAEGATPIATAFRPYHIMKVPAVLITLPGM